MLEILTGETVVGEGERSLGKWVKKREEEEDWKWEVFDFRDRLKMSTIHKMIEDIRIIKDGGVHSSFFSRYSCQSESTATHNNESTQSERYLDSFSLSICVSS